MPVGCCFCSVKHITYLVQFATVRSCPKHNIQIIHLHYVLLHAASQLCLSARDVVIDDGLEVLVSLNVHPARIVARC